MPQMELTFDDGADDDVQLPAAHEAFMSDFKRSADRHPPTPRHLVSPVVHNETVCQVASSLGISIKTPLSALIAGMVVRRGWDAPHLLSLLQAGSSHLPSFDRLKNSEAITNRICQAIHNSTHTWVVTDFDVDGITSAALWGSLLKMSNTPHTLIIPNRKLDGFGISDRITDQILRSHRDRRTADGLVILADHGSQAHTQIDRLFRHSVETIVFDHHEVHGELPNALVANPRQPGCGWHSQYPCAAGISHFFITEITRRLGLPQPDFSLAAIGTVADMVPLTASSICNRVIGRLGLADLRRTRNIGIQALARALQISTDPADENSFLFTSSDISFKIGPVLNAMGRLGDANECVELLLTRDLERASELAQKFVRNNEARKKLEGQLLEDALVQVASLESLPDAIAIYKDTHHLGVNGLLAQRIAQRWSRPTFVFAPNGEGIAVGSGRAGHEDYNIFEILHSAASHTPREPSAFYRFGGHKPAGGATIDAQRFDEVAAQLSTACKQQRATVPCAVTIQADCVMDLPDLTPKLFDQCEAMLEPFGNGFEAPHILFKGVRIHRIQPPRNRGGRYKLTLTQKGTRIEALIGSELWYHTLEHGALMNIIATPLKLYRNQERYIQLSIVGYSITAKTPESLGGDVTSSPHVLDTPESNTLFSAQIPKYSVPKPKLLKADPNTEVSPLTRRTLFDRSRQPPKLKAKLQELREFQRQFDSRYLYSDLHGLEPDFFNPKPADFYEPLWRALCRAYQLNFDYSALEMRPEAVEFIRYFFDTGGSHILQAATGSGKTKIALMIASQFLEAGHVVVFAAPTREIARQVFAELPALFGSGASRLLLIGGPPAGRQKALQEFRGGIIVGTAATLSNDVKNGALKLSSHDLLIDDECHHATGKHSSVSLIVHAREVGARRLLLSATPWQVTRGESRSQVAKLKELAEAESIFPLNRPPNPTEILVQFCELSPAMKAADHLLRQAMVTYRDELISYTDELVHGTLLSMKSHAPPQTSRSILDLLTKPEGASQKFSKMVASIKAPTPEVITLKDLLIDLLTIRKDVTRVLTQREGEYVSLNKVRALTASIARRLGYKSPCYWASRGAMELAYAHRILVHEGIVSFMSRALEKRCGALFPKPLGRGEQPSAWGKHITDLYAGQRSEFIKLAFQAVAPEGAKNIWERRHLESAFGTTIDTWNTLPKATRLASFKKGFAAVQKATLVACEDPDFFSHPGDEFILYDFGKHRRKSFIWVEKVSQVQWLAQQLNDQLRGSNTHVVGLTGTGRPGQSGMSSRQRDRALRAFRLDPRTKIIVGTTTLNEGIDVEGTTGYDRSLKGSFIQSTQKAGRPGRRNERGEMITICITKQHYRTLLSNISKSIENQKLLNEFRENILTSMGFPSTMRSAQNTKGSHTEERQDLEQSTRHQPWLF